MSIKCMLGLVACLNYQGAAIPAQTAVGILDSCYVIKQMPITEFGSGTNYLRGNAWAELLYDEGLRFKYPKNATSAQKKATVLRACHDFQIAFNDAAKWKNLDKWPY